MKTLPEASRAIVRHGAPHDQGPGSPDSAYASEAATLRKLLGEYEARAERLIDWEPEKKRKPGESNVDAAFNLTERLKREAQALRSAAYNAGLKVNKANDRADGMAARMVQLEGLLQAATERAVDMVAPGDKAKATALKLRETLGDLEGAQGILDKHGIGRYHPTTGEELTFTDRMGYFMRRLGTMTTEGVDVIDDIDPDDVVIIDMPGGGS